MRASFQSLSRLFQPQASLPIRSSRSTVRKLACESLATRIVLTASPLMELAIPEESLESVCVPLSAADVSWSGSESLLAEHDSSLHHDDPLAAMDSHVESSASTTAAVDAAMAAFASDASLPDEGETAPSHDESQDDLDWLSLEMLEAQNDWLDAELPEDGTSSEPTIDGSTAGDMAEMTFVNTWDSILPEGEGDELWELSSMDPTLADPEGDDLMDPDDDFDDPWADDDLNDPAMGDFTMVTFTARLVVGGYMFEGSVDYPHGDPQDLTIVFGGLATGHTTSVYHDGNFFYHFMVPDSYTGTVTAQAVDSNGLTSQTLYAFIWA